MTTVLEVVQEAAAALKQERPQFVVGNPDKLVAELLAAFNHVGWLLRRRYEWSFLTKKHSVTLQNGVYQYPLPGDFGRMVSRTIWAEAHNWEVIGPLSPQEDRFIREGHIADVGPRQRFRIVGSGANRFEISPTPGNSDAGHVISFEFFTENWILPPVWTPSSAVTAGSYRSYNGNFYVATNSGTTGVTPPTHTTGSVSDGAITFAFGTGAYSNPLTDNDFTLFDGRLVSLGIEWKWLQNNGMDFGPRQQEWQREVMRELTRYTGSRILSIASCPSDGLMSYDSIPDSGYGS